MVAQRVVEGLQEQRAELVHEVVEVRKDEFALQNHAEHPERRVLTLRLRNIAANQHQQRAALVHRHLRLPIDQGNGETGRVEVVDLRERVEERARELGGRRGEVG